MKKVHTVNNIKSTPGDQDEHNTKLTSGDKSVHCQHYLTLD